MTTVVRWNPFREFTLMQNALEQNLRATRPAFGGNLAIDVHENDNVYTVVATLPGLNTDDITINLHDGILSISAEIAQPEINENTRILVQERVFGAFKRSIKLPRDVNADAVEATYDNGILTLSIPKTEEAKPRQIAIKTNSKLLENVN